MILRYVTHPNVEVDPAIPVPSWSLSSEGKRRAQRLLKKDWLKNVTRLVTSPENKAKELALLIENHIGVSHEVFSNTGEVDRSSTGFVPHERHEALADQLYAFPEQSAEGWETAHDAQKRIVSALDPILKTSATRGETIVVGHGGVGTFLMCHLADWDIVRTHDQPGQGHYFSYDIAAQTLIHTWLPID